MIFYPALAVQKCYLITELNRAIVGDMIKSHSHPFVADTVFLKAGVLEKSLVHTLRKLGMGKDVEALVRMIWIKCEVRSVRFRPVEPNHCVLSLVGFSEMEFH